MKGIHLFTLGALVLSGCAMIASDSSIPGQGANDGTYHSNNVGFYSLPRALVTLEVYSTDKLISVAITSPVYAADPDHTYRLNYRQSPFASDKVEVTFETNSTLLKSVHVTAEDKTSDIILAAVKSVVGILESGDITKDQANPPVLIARITFDPADEVKTRRAILEANNFLKSFLLFKFRKPSDLESVVGRWCGGTSGTNLECNDPDWPIKLNISRDGAIWNALKADEQSSRNVNCSVGICYRPALPITFKMSFANVALDERTIDIPNGAPIFAMSVDRTSFVTKIKEIDFDSGMITKVRVEKPSEALEIAKLPLEIVSAIFSTVSQILQLKIDQSSKEKGLADAEVARIDANNKLRVKQTGTPESGGFNDGRRAVVVSVTNGYALPIISRPSLGNQVQPPSVPPQPPSGAGR